MTTIDLHREMILLTQAELDGELDAAEALRAATHRAGCADCKAAYRIVRATQAAMSANASRHSLSRDAREQIIARSLQRGKGTINHH